MDLGLQGRNALVCAASKGLGRACAEALASAGVGLTIAARGVETLEATARAIRAATGVDVRGVACDVSTEQGRAALLAACPAPDILVTNAGGPPPGDFRDFGLEDWRRALEANMLAPIALIHATIYGMMERDFGRIVNVTSFSVKAPIDNLELSNGARAGLTGAVSVLARRAVARGVTINNLLPGPFDTDRVRATTARAAEIAGRPVEDVARERRARIPAGRLRRPEEFGAAAAFLCPPMPVSSPVRTSSSMAGAILACSDRAPRRGRDPAARRRSCGRADESSRSGIAFAADVVREKLVVRRRNLLSARRPCRSRGMRAVAMPRRRGAFRARAERMTCRRRIGQGAWTP